MADENKILLTIDVDASEAKQKIEAAAETVSADTKVVDRQRQAYVRRRERILKRRRVRQRGFAAREAGTISREAERAARLSGREQKAKDQEAAKESKLAESAAEKERKQRAKEAAKKENDAKSAIDDMHKTLKRFAIGALFMQGIQIRGGTIIQTALATMADSMDKIALAGLAVGGPAGLVTAIGSRLASIFTDAVTRLMEYGKGTAKGAARFSPEAMAALAQRNVAELMSEIELSQKLGPRAAAAFRQEAALLRDPARMASVAAVRGLGIKAFEEGLKTETRIYQDVAKQLSPDMIGKAESAITDVFGLGSQAVSAAMQSDIPGQLLDVGTELLGIVKSILTVITGTDPETGEKLGPIGRLGIRRAPKDWSFWDLFKFNLFQVPPEGKSPPSGVGPKGAPQANSGPHPIPHSWENEFSRPLAGAGDVEAHGYQRMALI